MIGTSDIKAMTDNSDWLGWGYLGHELRSDETDEKLAAAANWLGLDEADVFLWANSRLARHFMDGYGPEVTSKGFEAALDEGLPTLRAEAA